MKPNCKKITQVINYLASRQGGKDVDELKIIKLIWAADRYHLRNYARTVTGDDYVAMFRGPVASTAKDLIEFETGYGRVDDDDAEYNSHFNTFSQINRDGFVSTVAATDTSELSQTDLEALDFALASFGAIPTPALVNFTHQYPEWKSHESELNEEKRVVPINLADFFTDPALKDDPFQTPQEILENSRAIFTEYV